MRTASGLILPLHYHGAGVPIVGAPSVAAANARPRDPDPPEAVVRELQREDPRWFLQFAHFPKPHWNVCQRWSLGDPKRARIQNGAIPPDADFDVICYCSIDIRADDVAGYVRQHLYRISDRDDVQKAADREQAAIDAHNAAARSGRLTHAKKELEHRLSRMTSHDRLLAAGATTAHTMIQGASLADGTGKAADARRAKHKAKLGRRAKRSA